MSLPQPDHVNHLAQKETINSELDAVQHFKEINAAVRDEYARTLKQYEKNESKYLDGETLVKNAVRNKRCLDSALTQPCVGIANECCGCDCSQAEADARKKHLINFRSMRLRHTQNPTEEDQVAWLKDK